MARKKVTGTAGVSGDDAGLDEAGIEGVKGGVNGGGADADTNSGSTDTGQLFIPGTGADGSGDSASGSSRRTGKRGRGRPRGSSKQAEASAENLTAILFSMHMMLAKLVNIEELNIEEEEAKRYAEAIERVQRLYSSSVLPEEAMAWINLAMVGGSIYAPRLIAYNQRVRVERAKPVGPGSGDGPSA